MTVSNYFYMSGIEKRAAKQVYLRHRINGMELNVLMGLSAYLMLYNKKIVSREIFADWQGLNFKLEKKIWFLIQCLVDKGLCHRLAYRRPDGNSIAISVYGERVLECFEVEIMKIIKEDKAKNLSYKSLQLDMGNLPQGYKLMQRGRDS